jgi:hypothetical protein
VRLFTHRPFQEMNGGEKSQVLRGEAPWSDVPRFPRTRAVARFAIRNGSRSEACVVMIY